MSKLSSIFCYPIKGLNGQKLEQVTLIENTCLPYDRMYALALADTEFDPENPVFLPKRHFLMLMRDEKLAELETVFSEEGHILTIKKDGVELLTAALDAPGGEAALADFFYDFMGGSLKGKPRLVKAPGHMFADVPQKNLTIINLDTVKDIEAKTGLTIDPRRFRSNLYVEGIGAWREFDLIDQSFTIGDVTFSALSRVDRCAATNVNPDTAERDMNLPLQIRKNYGHLDCGIYVDVIKGGMLKKGDTITL
ncbi:MOSC domain-containing protein [Kordiimonas pumila]|uniref:MOSC domain-containing protein n=1 Tax=Kordiimonas pumila TaxID=2161677 RepID=A0ABV7D7Z0_9PROT|nr:MOSC domain-containing protein [Kordiimonas pumila]